MAVQARGRPIEVFAHVDSRLADVVTGHPGRVRQALLNPGTNAVKFTPAGEIEPALEVLHSDAQPGGAAARGGGSARRLLKTAV